MSAPSEESPYSEASASRRPADRASGVQRVPFVPRSASTRAGDARATGAGEAPLPSLRWRSVRLLVLLTVALQALSWWILDGYQLADSVEYVENAQALVRGHDVLDSHALRSYFFPLLLTPPLWLADAFGVQDFREVFWLMRGFQMLLGLLLVRVCVRIGARLAGPRAGLVAGFLVAINPVFLQYTVSPITDIAAALCIGHALEALMERGGFRRGMRGGAWLGLSVLVSYKTFLVLGTVLLMLVLRDRWKQRREVAGFGTGALLLLGSQALLDKLTYGVWALSMKRYFLSNFGPIMAKLCWKLHDAVAAVFGEEFASRLGLMELAKPLYGLAFEGLESAGAVRGLLIKGQFPPHWYVMHLDEFFVWPLLALLVLGLGLCVKRARWRSSLLLLVAVLYCGVLSTKGSKDFRLWLPTLPAFTPIVAWGWTALAGAGERVHRARPIVAGALLVVALGLGVQQLLERNTRKFSGYWDAIEVINGVAAEERAADPEAPRVRAASAYHWAVFLRESADVELEKLPHQLDGWTNLTELEKRRVLFELVEQEWFITHLPVLTDPDHEQLLRVVNRYFAVHAVLWDRTDFEEIGPVLVLRKRTGAAGERTLYEIHAGLDIDEYRRAHGFPPPVRLIRPELGEEVWFLGFSYDVVPPHAHGWITYHYFNAGPTPRADYTIVDRLTTYDERNSWQNNHAPCYGAYPTVTWQSGWIVRESYPVVACEEPFKWDEPYRPMGGAYRRGDVMPANLWLDFVTFGRRCKACGHWLNSDECCPGVERTVDDAEPAVVTGRLERARFGAQQPIRRGPHAGQLTTPEGWRFSKDGLQLVGRFLLPVHPTARAADDGRGL
jgi:hypothetical protein